MTVFCGIVQSAEEGRLTDTQCAEAKSHVENGAGQRVTFEYRSELVYLVALDIGAFGHKGIVEDDQAVTIITGDPLLRSDAKETRTHDAEVLHREFINENADVLQRAKGVFSGAHYNKKTGKVFLFTDKLGVRPVFFYKNKSVIAFASLLRYLETLSFLDLSEDLKGILQQIAFTFPIGDGTPYKFIKLLKSSEIIEFTRDHFSTRIYWLWDRIPVSTDSSYAELVEATYGAFQDAVKLRLGDERNAIAFLSGGMDSRCITSLIRKNVDNLYTFNFSVENSQDKEFAKSYSNKLNSVHFETTFKKLAYPNFSFLIANAWLEKKTGLRNQPTYPQQVWSGDGGSVSAGHVYLNDQMVGHLENGNIHASINEFLRFNKIALPGRFFLSPYRKLVTTLLHESVGSELGSLDCQDIGRKLYLFLMFNDQRRHLSTHFETIDKHKIELVLPFFDSAWENF